MRSAEQLLMNADRLLGEAEKYAFGSAGASGALEMAKVTIQLANALMARDAQRKAREDD